MNKECALIGMSGGVDSSVAAYLTLQAGFNCIGVTMRLYNNETIGEHTKTCCTQDDAEDARSVARRLGIPHYVFNFQDDFQKCVISQFVASYEAGQTPNPCIECNRYLKFDRLLRRAMELGCDYVVSGHYARVCKDEETGRYLLYKAKDLSKDQSYFLACLSQEQLSHIRFPLGELTKVQVREIAQQQGFITAKKHDSQDICFVPDGDYAAFLSRFTGKEYHRGNYLDLNGNVVGQHCGAVRYTIGQRKGLGLAMGSPVYVCAKNMQENTITVGPNEALFSNALRANHWQWFPFPALTTPLAVSVKIRHSQTQQPAMAYPEADGFVRVEFNEAHRAISPGQAVVLYQGDLVVGGGTIVEALR